MSVVFLKEEGLGELALKFLRATQSYLQQRGQITEQFSRMLRTRELKSVKGM